MTKPVVTPGRMDRPTRWVSCARTVEWSTARYRHLTYQLTNDEWTTTFCGATGTPGALRGDSRKRKCPVCLGIQGGGVSAG